MSADKIKDYELSRKFPESATKNYYGTSNVLIVHVIGRNEIIVIPTPKTLIPQWKKQMNTRSRQ